VAAARALDQILLWNHYVVPQWSYSKLRTARWNGSVIGDMPKYGMSAFPAVWWWDAEKATKTGGKRPL
jgi:microcin C transport system substrate-binding protein